MRYGRSVIEQRVICGKGKGREGAQRAYRLPFQSTLFGPVMIEGEQIG